jgi:hypothetical protein
LYVREDALGMAEGIVARHVPKYDHFSMADIRRDVGRKLIAEWRDAADRLPVMDVQEVYVALNLAASYRERLDAEIESHRAEMPPCCGTSLMHAASSMSERDGSASSRSEL